MNAAEKVLDELDNLMSDDPASGCIRAANLLSKEKRLGHQLRLLGRLVKGHWRLGNHPAAEKMVREGTEIIREAERRGSTDSTGLSPLDRAEFCGYCNRYACAREDWDAALSWLDAGLRLTMPRSADAPTSAKGKAMERRRGYLRAVTLVSHARHLAVHGEVDRADAALDVAFRITPKTNRRTPRVKRRRYDLVRVSILSLRVSILIGADQPIPDDLMSFLEDPGLAAGLGRISRAELHRCIALAATHRKELNKAVEYYSSALKDLRRAGAYGEMRELCGELRKIAPRRASSWIDLIDECLLQVSPRGKLGT